MKFSEIKLQLPDFEKIKRDFIDLNNKFLNVNSFDEAKNIFEEIQKLQNNYYEGQNIALINNAQDTNNKLFKSNFDFYQDLDPEFNLLVSNFGKSMINSDFKNELELEYGSLIFKKFQNLFDITNESIIIDRKEENRLVSEYAQLNSKAQIDFQGKNLNLMQFMPYFEDVDRDIRVSSKKTYWDYFKKNKDKYEGIYDNLVHLRNNMAKKLNFNSFTEFAYKERNRIGYGREEIKDFRNTISQFVSPKIQEIQKKQLKKLNLDKLKFSDEDILFLDGNPKPLGDSSFIIQKAKEMYSDISIETKEFSDLMINNELMDLNARKGKRGGGFATFIPNLNFPFLFGNFVGTTFDIKVLTHEFGHCFQAYSGIESKMGIGEYTFPTFEAVEIHSMSMEHITLDYMNLFFNNNDTKKFKSKKIIETLKSLPYMCAVDEFQEYIYDNPNLTSKQRNEYWREMELKYISSRDYGEIDYLNEGVFWQKQMHIFHTPFYYIDYALALVSSMEIYNNYVENPKETWQNYMNLCKIGGSQEYLNILKAGNLSSPFNRGKVEKIIEEYYNKLDY